jgi:rubrerythrin
MYLGGQMSEKNAIIEYLNLLKTAEKKTADLYSYIGKITAANPVLSELFSVLAQEELIHVKYFDMLKDFQVESESLLLELGDANESIAAILEDIRKRTETIRSLGQAATEKELIEGALAVENGLMERHGISAIRITDETLRKLFQSLKFADEAHIQRLQKYLDERKKK